MSKKIQSLVAKWPVRITKAKLNQKQLAALTNVTEANLSKIIRGLTIPRAKTVKRIDDVLKSRKV